MRAALLLLLPTLVAAQADLPVLGPRHPMSSPTTPPHAAPANLVGGERPDRRPDRYWLGTSVSVGDTLVIVLDVSASMRGLRLETAKAETIRFISTLDSDTAFTVVAYNHAAWSWQEDLIPATSAAKAAAIGFVSTLIPFGHTNTGEAVWRAKTFGPEQVLLATDGYPSDGTLGIERARGNPPIHVVGIDLDSAARAYCWGIAQASGGSYVDTPIGAVR